MIPFPLDHVAVAVTSLEEAVPIFELLTGETGSPVEELPAQGVRVCFVGSVELLEPLEPETTVGRFLHKRGQSLHHIAYRVPDLSEAMNSLAAQGLELIDETPRRGARGHLVAFLNPRSTQGILTELVEADEE